MLASCVHELNKPNQKQISHHDSLYPSFQPSRELHENVKTHSSLYISHSLPTSFIYTSNIDILSHLQNIYFFLCHDLPKTNLFESTR
jgi:hypothetical protein